LGWSPPGVSVPAIPVRSFLNDPSPRNVLIARIGGVLNRRYRWQFPRFPYQIKGILSRIFSIMRPFLRCFWSCFVCMWRIRFAEKEYTKTRRQRSIEYGFLIIHILRGKFAFHGIEKLYLLMTRDIKNFLIMRGNDSFI